jgi:hypothetical protein
MRARSLLCLCIVAVVLPGITGAGWTEDDLWTAEMKLDELRDAVADQVGTRRVLMMPSRGLLGFQDSRAISTDANCQRALLVFENTRACVRVMSRAVRGARW